MKDIREWPLNIFFSMSTENKECHLQISDSELPLIRIFFGPKTQVSGAGFVRKVKSQEQHAWNEPLFASPRVGLRSRHCAKRQLSGIGILEMSYLRAEFVPNSMS